MLTLNLYGIQKLRYAIYKIHKNSTDGLESELKASVLNMQRRAKAHAPKNNGTLAQSIGVAGRGLNWEFFATVAYAGYMEFGTGKKVKVPIGFEKMASEWKNRNSGTFKEFVKALALWIKRKGVVGTYSIKTKRRTGNKVNQRMEDYAAAYAIARAILKKGVKPQPFLIPAFLLEVPILTKRLNNLFS